MKKIVILSCLLAAGCATPSSEAPPAAFRLSSPQFADNAMLERKNAGNFAKNPNCTGQNVSPALQWTNAPDKTRSFAIILDDRPAASWRARTPSACTGSDPARRRATPRSTTS